MLMIPITKETYENLELNTTYLTNLPEIIRLSALQDVRKDVIAEDMMSKMREVMSEYGKEISNDVSALKKDVNTEMCGMLLKVSGMIKETLEKLDIETLSAKVSEGVAEILEENEEGKEEYEAQLQNIPKLISTTVQKLSTSNETSIGAMKTEMRSMVNKIEEATRKLEAMGVQRSKNAYKGQEGESKIYEMLSEHLAQRGGTRYQVTKVRGQAQSGDMMVYRDGCEAVMIEVKLYENKVGTEELRKFERDLISQDKSGIFVSLKSGIVGKGKVDIEQLMNGKFAVYLSENEYNVQMIGDWLRLLYKLSSHLGSKDDTSCRMIKISPETMQHVRVLLKEMTTRVDDSITQLKSVIKTLSEVNMDRVKEMLMVKRDDVVERGSSQKVSTNTKSYGGNCPQCNKECKNIKLHQPHCKGWKALA